MNKPTRKDTSPSLLRRVETMDDIAVGLELLLALDPRLAPIAAVIDDIPLRRRPADFAGLSQIIIGQQVSVASAAAIFARLEQAVSPLTAENLANHNDDVLIACGLSRPKVKTLRVIQNACQKERLDLSALTDLPASEAHATLCALPGIGPWTADIFLLFCAGHPDVFPAGDLALQVAVAEAFGLGERLSDKQLRQEAEAWAPYRAIAARLFWSWYKIRRKGRETMPL